MEFMVGTLFVVREGIQTLLVENITHSHKAQRADVRASLGVLTRDQSLRC